MPPQSQPLLQSSDITYLGFFNVPHGTADAFTYGGSGLAIGADGVSLYFGGIVTQSTLGRITIPALGATASIITNPVSVPGTLAGDLVQVNGALVWNGRLIIQKASHYDAVGTNPTHLTSALNLTGMSTMYRMANLNQDNFGNGYMGIIPPEWRTLLGGPCFSGNSNMGIISMCSVGPSFYAFNPDDVGVTTPIPSVPLMYFPYSNPLDDITVANNLLSWADIASGILFPSGTRSVLFVSKHGYGAPVYKVEQGCGEAAGTGAYPYRRQVTAFDANDLLAVKNGTKLPYAVRPYAFWTLPGPVVNCANMTFSGLAYDDTTRRMYVTFYQGSNPRVDVFQVSGASTTTPNAPTGLRIV